MPDYKCTCGAVLANRYQKANHCKRCPQWKEYLRTIIADPEFLRLKREVGIGKASVHFGLSENTLKGSLWRPLLQQQEQAEVKKQIQRLPESPPRPSPALLRGGQVVSLTASSILNAIRSLINEHELCPRRIAELETKVKGLERENEHLRISLSQTSKALDKLREAELEPVRLRIQHEALLQAREK